MLKKYQKNKILMYLLFNINKKKASADFQVDPIVKNKNNEQAKFNQIPIQLTVYIIEFNNLALCFYYKSRNLLYS